MNLQNEVWKDGPELKYNVTYIADITPHNATSDHNATTIVRTLLRCRPRKQNITSCYLENSSVRMRPFNSTDFASPPTQPTTPDGLRLEIVFNETGIKNLIVPSTITPQTLDMARSIVNQLHVGIDLNDISAGIYQNWETFTTGNCLTTYAIKLADTRTSTENNVQGFSTWRPNVRALINKTRDVKQCRSSSPYFFTSREGFRDEPRIIVTMVSNIFQCLLTI